MFDMLVAENLVDLIEEEGLRRSFSRVRAIRLRIGALGHVEPAALYSCFDEASEGSIGEGARLDLEMVPGEGWCPDCSEIVSVEKLYDACRLCRQGGGADPDARTGRDSDLNDRDRGVPHQSPPCRRRLANQVRAPFPAQAGSSRTL
jgi:hydrogenase nickel incorporation protein HypA/HybF